MSVACDGGVSNNNRTVAIDGQSFAINDAYRSWVVGSQRAKVRRRRQAGVGGCALGVGLARSKQNSNRDEQTDCFRGNPTDPGLLEYAKRHYTGTRKPTAHSDPY